MPALRLSLFTAIAMLAFAGNSLLCRVAIAGGHIDAISYTQLRLLSGALGLWLLNALLSRRWRIAGNWLSALALFAYAAGFSLAYVRLSAATGALLLFGSVQLSMIVTGLIRGERLQPLQWLGLAVAVVGLLLLLLPGTSAPALLPALFMVFAGIAWGVYSLRGRGAKDAAGDTAGNFVRAVPFAILLSLVHQSGGAGASWDAMGLGYAIFAGAIASGLGYIIWYRALPWLRATTAATVQLSVPALAALGGVLLLGEALSTRLLLASVAILGGLAVFIRFRRVVA